MNRDEMIAKVAEALEGSPLYRGWGRAAARIAVEALEQAGGFSCRLAHFDARADTERWRERAERAEAEVERLIALAKADSRSLAQKEAEVEHWKRQASIKADQARAEYALADELAAALRDPLTDDDNYSIAAAKALAKWEEARREAE